MSEEKYKIKILPPAQRELEEIAHVHYELIGSQSARKITNRIYDSLAHLSAMTHMGVSCADKPLKSQGYRILICGNYLCIYRMIEDTVFVYHIADGRADYPKLMNDLPK